METENLSFNATKNPVHARYLHATILHLLGFDDERFTFKSRGFDQKLTGVVAAHDVHDLLA